MEKTLHILSKQNITVTVVSSVRKYKKLTHIGVASEAIGADTGHITRTCVVPQSTPNHFQLSTVLPNFSFAHHVLLVQ